MTQPGFELWVHGKHIGSFVGAVPHPGDLIRAGDETYRVSGRTFHYERQPKEGAHGGGLMEMIEPATVEAQPISTLSGEAVPYTLVTDRR